MSESNQLDGSTLVSRLIQRYPDAYLDDEDRLVVERVGVQYQDGHAMDHTYTLDLTALFQNAPRTTGSPDHLVIEAELADETSYVGNPAEPLDEATEEAARERIEARGLTPAWEVGT